MKITIERAKIEDMGRVENLYFQRYGKDYPIELVNDKEKMKVAVENSNDYYWLIAKDEDNSDRIVGSTVFQLDRKSKIGKVIGVVVSTDYCGNGIAKELIKKGSDRLLGSEDEINMLYTTTRTVEIASQLMFLRNDYLPMGICPNAHKIHRYETLTIIGKFRDGVLENRKYVPVISEKLKPLLKFSNMVLGKKFPTKFRRESVHKNYDLKYSSEEERPNFEFIYAPEFVNKRFKELFKDRIDHFCPFDVPNLLISDVKRDLELYAYFSKKDHYCVLIGVNKTVLEYGHHLEELIFQMKDYGVSYMEALLRLDWDVSIEYMLNNQFLPSAIFPALKEENGVFYDYILLSRTMQPLDFTGVEIDSSFRPYVDQYIKQWIKMHVSSLQVVDSK